MSQIAILRHWVAEYKKLKVDNAKKYSSTTLDEFKNFANDVKDLNEDKLLDLDKNISEYINTHFDILKNKEIKIWVSPFGRTIQTAKHLLDWLQLAWLPVKSVSLVENLEEVKNFYWPILRCFALGGDLELDGKTITIDQTITNPQNLSVTDYFFQWWYRKVDPKYLENIWLKEKIMNIETYDEITTRSKSDLTRIMNAVSDNTFLFLVSHQAFTDWISVKKDNYQNKWQQPGEFITVDRDEFQVLLSD